MNIELLYKISSVEVFVAGNPIRGNSDASGADRSGQRELLVEVRNEAEQGITRL